MRFSPTVSRVVRVLLAATGATVCLAQAQLPDHTARVTVQYGQISILSDRAQRAISVGDAIKPQQLIIAGPDGYAKFEVSDGSTFEVFANSQVMFRDHMGDWQQLLNVLIGHVKVYIQKLNGLPNYNKVSSPTALISVRGTMFEVLVEDNDGTTFVSVEEGLVGVRNETAAGGEVSLMPGDSIRVIRNQPLIPAGVAKGAIMQNVLRAAEQAIYQMVYSSRGGMGLPRGGIGGVPTAPTANGDKGKGGGAPTSPGGSTTPTSPSAPSAPGSAP
jgi:hypothetical protein